MFIYLNKCVYFFTLLNTKRRNIHRGELLKAAVDNSPIRITQLTKRMGISRGTYYNHIEDAELPFELLERYGRFLHHDFTQDLPAMRKYAFEEDEAPYNAPANLKEAVEQRDLWREKYYRLLEQFNKLLLERNNS